MPRVPGSWSPEPRQDPILACFQSWLWPLGDSSSLGPARCPQYVGLILVGRTWHRCPGPRCHAHLGRESFMCHQSPGSPSVPGAQKSGGRPCPLLPPRRGCARTTAHTPREARLVCGGHGSCPLGPRGALGTQLSVAGAGCSPRPPRACLSGLRAPSPPVFTACVQVEGPPSCGGLWAVGRTTWAGPGALRSHPGICEGQAAGRGQSSPAQAMDRGPGCDREASWDSVCWVGGGQTSWTQPRGHLSRACRDAADPAGGGSAGSTTSPQHHPWPGCEPADVLVRTAMTKAGQAPRPDSGAQPG